MLDNINPSLWGPHYWKVMHYITIAYPDNPTPQDKEDIKNFFMAMGKVLPCENCRIHYAMNIQKYPLTNDILSSKYKIINWAKDIHNEVNIRTGKKPLSYEDVIEGCKKQNKINKIEIITIVLLIILMIIICVYIKYKFDI